MSTTENTNTAPTGILRDGRRVYDWRQEVTAEIRRRWPRARRIAPVGIVKNTSCRRVSTCIVCGSRNSYCPKWPEPVSHAAWREQHNAECGERLVRRPDADTTEGGAL